MEDQYGDWKDWLLCLAIIAALEARIPVMVRNPDGHSPKYWKKHSPKLQNPSIPGAEHIVPPLPLWKKLLGAGVISVVFGGALSAMFSNHPYPADVFFVVGFGLIVAALTLTPELTRHRKFTWLMIPSLLVMCSWNHYLNDAWPFSLKSQLVFSCHMNGVYRSEGKDTEVYFKINNLPEAAIQYLDVTLSRASKAGIRGVSEFTYADCRGDPVNVFPQERSIFRGATGGRLSIGTEGVTEDYMQHFGSPQWRIQCSRLSGQSFREFSMQVAGDAENDILNISGSYELTSSDGSKRVRVNQTCKVTQ
jgi:hypothetical protein